MSKSQIIAQNRPEIREKKSKSGTITQNRPEVIEKRSKSEKIAQNRPETIERHSKSGKITQTKLWQDPEYREKQIRTQIIAQNRPEVKERYRISNAKPEVKKKRSDSAKIKWQDPEYREKQLLAMSKGLGLLPNKPETFLINFLDQLYPNEWKYTGDYSFLIDGKNPDFVNINGQKKCIEHYGTFWHKDHDPQDRINLFKSYGWDCLVIWEHELKDFKSLRRKIFDFAEK
uniref:DUF559 domain-containing protein n=1 Tax=viral metagenome TaxID=1070528 RepID=A0A6M3MG28_9ZZZZ